jgi:N-acetyl-alpha-D-muramate 1-phosphate uridylyltransferase
MNGSISHAMVLAAGLGQRMRPITDHLPKPLVVVGGKPMLDHALDRLAAVGVGTAVVNVHHLASQIEDHLRPRTVPRIIISDEREMLLETGGGVKKALHLLGGDPFFHLNSDSLWAEPPGAMPNLARMAAAWDAARMDILLLLARRATSFGYDGRGDFHMGLGGILTRRGGAPEAEFVYAGVAILKPELFADAPKGAFSLNLQFDKAIAQGRLSGHELEGQWLHVGTPQAIEGANARLAVMGR